MSAAQSAATPVIGARLSTGLACACGSLDIVAVEPGDESQTFEGFTYQRGQPERRWCMRCRFPTPLNHDTNPREDIQMARKKAEDWTQVPEVTAAPPDRDDALGDADTETAILVQDMAADTLTGDMRDFILDRLKHEQSKRPWHERSEADQRATVHEVEASVRATIVRAVELIAGEGKRSIKATLESVTVKDGIKASLSLSKFDPHRFGLIDATGHTVLVIVADPDEFTGEREPVAINPDQATLLGDGVMVQHSPVDGAETPFH